MAKALTLEQAGKALLWFICSTVALFVGPRFADRLIFDPHAAMSLRYLGIALSILSLVPWLGYVAWGLTVADEFHRQTLLIGTAVAFAFAILFSISTQLMADARLVPEVITINLPIGFLLWLAGIGATALWERVRSRG